MAIREHLIFANPGQILGPALKFHVHLIFASLADLQRRYPGLPYYKKLLTSGQITPHIWTLPLQICANIKCSQNLSVIQYNWEETIAAEAAAIARDWNQKNRPQGPILINPLEEGGLLYQYNSVSPYTPIQTHRAENITSTANAGGNKREVWQKWLKVFCICLQIFSTISLFTHMSNRSNSWYRCSAIGNK